MISEIRINRSNRWLRCCSMEPIGMAAGPSPIVMVFRSMYLGI